jgi:hypothetical protein
MLLDKLDLQYNPTLKLILIQHEDKEIIETFFNLIVGYLNHC